MKRHLVKTYPSKKLLKKEDQLAYKLAQLAVNNVEIDGAAAEMVGNRIIDNASVAIAAINRRPVQVARQQALAHPKSYGATVFGLPSKQRFDCHWAAWANNVAVRELDMHDTFLAADYSHPGDNIPAILAVAQQKGISGLDLVKGILTAYEVQIDLVKGICLHEHKKDHIAHLAPAVAAGIGTMLKLDTETIFHAINQSVHLAFSTRQSRKGEISSWKAYAPAHAGKLAIEAVDRAMRGEKAPTPIYEGEDSVIAWMLGGNNKEYEIQLPEKGMPCLGILDSYTKEHSAEYQAQALIDIGISLNKKNIDLSKVKEVIIHTSHHTHYVIGTGSNDPQKFDPNATRETLDHSVMYILATSWEDGCWHHERSYTKERTNRPSTIELWNKIKTVEAKEWTDAYHSTDPAKKKFGAEVEVKMEDGTTICERLDNANAHANGAAPFGRSGYINKFQVLSEGLVESSEVELFLELVGSLPKLDHKQLLALNVVIKNGLLEGAVKNNEGIF